MTRRQEREEAFFMLFEADFSPEKTIEEIYMDAKDARDVEESDYIRTVLDGVCAHRDMLDEVIEPHLRGWKRSRLSGVARTVLRLAVYEMLYMPDIPLHVSLNEAVELIKKYDEAKARGFVNGVLNAVSHDEKVLAAREACAQ